MPPKQKKTVTVRMGPASSPFETNAQKAAAPRRALSPLRASEINSLLNPDGSIVISDLDALAQAVEDDGKIGAGVLQLSQDSDSSDGDTIGKMLNRNAKGKGNAKIIRGRFVAKPKPKVETKLDTVSEYFYDRVENCYYSVTHLIDLRLKELLNSNYSMTDEFMKRFIIKVLKEKIVVKMPLQFKLDDAYELA